MKLAEYLKAKNVHVKDFAETIGVKQPTVTRYALGHRTPRPKHMVKIIEATDGKVTANDFVPTRESAQ